MFSAPVTADIIARKDIERKHMALRADENPRDIANTIPEVIHDLLKDVHTAIQGTIVTYDPATRRARVRPSLRRRDESGAVVDRPEVDQVPVQWPGGDGTTAHATLQEDDQVYLIYSMRGYRAWLEKHEPAVQDLEGFLERSSPRCSAVVRHVAIR